MTPPVKRYCHVVEIGAGDRFSTEGLSWCTHAEQVTLIEPHKLLWSDLNRAAAGLPNVRVHYMAVTAVPGAVASLYHMGYASFLKGSPSFLSLSVEPEGLAFWEPLLRPVPYVYMGEFDLKGDIDYLILTTGGGEASILEAMHSRPEVIRTKHYLHNAAQWADADATFAWMMANRYGGRVVETVPHGTFIAVEWRRA